MYLEANQTKSYVYQKQGNISVVHNFIKTHKNHTPGASLETERRHCSKQQMNQTNCSFKEKLSERTEVINKFLGNI